MAGHAGHPSEPTFEDFGMGGMERLVVYPMLAWTAALAIGMADRRPVVAGTGDRG
jgi:hypothetical protein